MTPHLGTFVHRCLLLACAAASADWRSLDAGALMLQDQYLDQPYVAVIPRPGGPPASTRWVCCITRNSAPEGRRGEHVACLHSDDAGGSWSTPVKLEPGAGTVEGLTNAYSSVLATTFGRVYVTYNLNIDNVTHFPDGQAFTRDDTQGAYVARWSDDGGVSWSAQRVTLPMRSTAIDRANVPFNGTTLMMWSVDQYKSRVDGAEPARVFLGFTKVGTYGYLPPEEAWLWSSPNLATERNVSRVVWEQSPSGERGVASVPPDTVIEEAHVAPLSVAHGGGGVFAVFRTDQGHLGAAATRDARGAAGWGPAHAASYWAATPAAAGRVVRNPRGPITLRRLAAPSARGRYLLLYYNNADRGFTSRNPYWVSVGVEDAALGEIRFSQPEVALVDAEDQSGATGDRAGYPDIVEDAAAASAACAGCTVFVTETNKTFARTHGLPPAFLALLLAQDTLATAATAGLALTLPAAARGARFPTPPLAAFAPRGAYQAGWSVEFYLARWAPGDGVAPGQTLLDVRGGGGSGFAVAVVRGGGASRATTLALVLCDDAGVAANLTLDAVCASLLAGPAPVHAVTLVVDASTHIALVVVDGFVCDGGADALRGWAWLPFALGPMDHAAREFVWGGDYGGGLLGGRWYGRAISVSEAVGNARAGAPRSEADPGGAGGASGTALAPAGGAVPAVPAAPYGVVGAPPRSAPRVPVDPAAWAWLQNETQRLITGCAESGVGGVRIYTPDASAHYAAQWTRDFTMAVLGAPDVFRSLHADLPAAIAYSTSRVLGSGKTPDRVTAAGEAVFSPGIGTWACTLAYDNNAYIALLVAAYAEEFADAGFFCAQEHTVRAALDFVPLVHGLAFNDPAAPNVSFGFEDSVIVPGSMLTVSLLMYDAAVRAAALAAHAQCGNATHYAALARGIAANVDRLHDATSSLFLASDNLETLPDVWGSAYVVALGLSTPQRRAGVVAFFSQQWSSSSPSVFQEGQLRHLPQPLQWLRCWRGCPADGTYQNGAFWATPLQWLLPALQPTHPALASAIADAALASFQAHGIMEAINRNISYAGVRDYVASAAALLGATMPRAALPQ